MSYVINHGDYNMTQWVQDTYVHHKGMLPDGAGLNDVEYAMEDAYYLCSEAEVLGKTDICIDYMQAYSELRETVFMEYLKEMRRRERIAFVVLCTYNELGIITSRKVQVVYRKRS